MPNIRIIKKTSPHFINHIDPTNLSGITTVKFFSISANDGDTEDIGVSTPRLRSRVEGEERELLVFLFSFSFRCDKLSKGSAL